MMESKNAAEPIIRPVIESLSQAEIYAKLKALLANNCWSSDDSAFKQANQYLQSLTTHTYPSPDAVDAALLGLFQTIRDLPWVWCLPNLANTPIAENAPPFSFLHALKETKALAALAGSRHLAWNSENQKIEEFARAISKTTGLFFSIQPASSRGGWFIMEFLPPIAPLTDTYSKVKLKKCMLYGIKPILADFNDSDLKVRMLARIAQRVFEYYDQYGATWANAYQEFYQKTPIISQLAPCSEYERTTDPIAELDALYGNIAALKLQPPGLAACLHQCLQAEIARAHQQFATYSYMGNTFQNTSILIQESAEKDFLILCIKHRIDPSTIGPWLPQSQQFLDFSVAVLYPILHEAEPDVFYTLKALIQKTALCDLSATVIKAIENKEGPLFEAMHDVLSAKVLANLPKALEKYRQKQDIQALEDFVKNPPQKPKTTCAIQRASEVVTVASALSGQALV